jgi:hypothetical protein
MKKVSTRRKVVGTLKGILWRQEYHYQSIITYCKHVLLYIAEIWTIEKKLNKLNAVEIDL